jgi:hypothetical protein
VLPQRFVTGTRREDWLPAAQPISLAQPEPHSVLVWVDDQGIARARDGRTGRIIAESTDHASVIQAAIDALKDGGVIFFKRGEYKIANVQITKRAALVGEGALDTYFRLAEAGYLFVVSAPYVSFVNLGFNGSGKLGSGIKFTGGAHYCEVRNCNFYNFRVCIDVNVDAGTSALLGLVMRNTFDTFDIGVRLTAAAGKWANDWLILYNRLIGGSGAVAVEIGKGDGANSKTIVYGNSIESNGVGVDLGANAGYSIIAGNRFERCSTGVSFSGAAQYVSIVRNRFISVTNPINGTPGGGSEIRMNIGYATENGGIVAFSGDGAKTQFAIPHRLAAAPSKVLVTPGSSDAKGPFHVTADTTNIYVNYATAPPAGTNNVVLYWYAEL